MAYIDKKRILLGPWQDVTGDRERNAMIMALRAVERREGERRGWDQPTQVWTLHLADMDTDVVEIRPVPTRAWRTGAANPVDDLIATAERQPPPDRTAPHMAYADAPDGLAAVAMMTEGWAVPDTALTDDQRRRRAAGERVAVESPHRIETRMIHAADINGHGYGFNRFRGEEPLPVDLIDPDRMWAETGAGPGRLIRALYCLAYAARTHGWPHT